MLSKAQLFSNTRVESFSILCRKSLEFMHQASLKTPRETPSTMHQ